MAPLSEKYILIADDQQDIGLMLKMLFEKSGYRTKVVENGVKALEEIEHEKPALVVSDILMPHLNGFKLCETIKGDPRTSHIPVILLTAVYRNNQHVDMGFSYGADAYFTKPFDNNQILYVSQKLMGEERT